MNDLSRNLLIVGGIFIMAGLIVMVGARFNIPLGRLPGDITYRGRHATVFVPVVSCILISVVLSLLLWFFNRGAR